MTTSPLLDLPGMTSHRSRIEAALHGAVTTQDAYLTEIASHLIVAGGKRLRPVMAVAAAQVGRDGPVSDEVVQGSIACELVHLGSLYHDDVMDESDTRRGVETVNAKWGNLQAILAGDFLLARASEIAAALGDEVAMLLAQTISRLCLGQFEEMCQTYDRSRTVPAYLSSINGKTAALFSSSARIGALVAGHPRDIVDTVTEIADAYGMAFQIADDILDITSTDAELGKPAGHDMEEGVYTLPVLLTLADGSTSAAALHDLLGGPLSGSERDAALEIVRSGPGVARALAVARSYAEQAEAKGSLLPLGLASDALRLAPAHFLDSLHG